MFVNFCSPVNQAQDSLLQQHLWPQNRTRSFYEGNRVSIQNEQKK